MDIKKDSPIAPIYNSLDQLLQYNKGLLKLFRKSKAPGLLQAIWGSRDGEIETLRRQLNDSQEKLNAYRKEKYKHQKRECEDKSEIKALMQLVSELHQKNSQDQDKIHSLQNKLDQVSEKINSQEYQKVFQIEKKLRISYLGISRLEEERKRLYKELDSEKEKVRLMKSGKRKIPGPTRPRTQAQSKNAS